MIVPIYFEVDHKKTGFGPKNSIFGPQKGHFGQSGPRNGPPGGQTATYRKTEGIQSYLRIWGTYDPIESGPSDPKKWGLCRRSVKKCRFSGQLHHFFCNCVFHYWRSETPPGGSQDPPCGSQAFRTEKCNNNLANMKYRIGCWFVCLHVNTLQLTPIADL